MNMRRKTRKLAVPLARSTDQAVPTYEPTSEEVRTRAYEIYVQRGRADGFDIEDWLQAKNELKGSSDKRKQA